MDVTQMERVSEDVIEDLRLCLYRSLADTGRLPDLERLVEVAGDVGAVSEGMRALAVARHVALDDDGEVAHFLVPAERIWDDVIHTCSNQRLFCGHACIDEWLAVNDEPEGSRLDLDTLWRLAAHWYDGRLERGYRRRDPSSAHDYLRSVGLSGPFWGL